jgi:hypothetical protein
MERREDAFKMRRFSAGDVLDGDIDLRDYPNRYLFLYADTALAKARLGMPRLLEAIEMLEGQGWDLVNVLAKDNFYAVMRRA